MTTPSTVFVTRNAYPHNLTRMGKHGHKDKKSPFSFCTYQVFYSVMSKRITIIVFLFVCHLLIAGCRLLPESQIVNESDNINSEPSYFAEADISDSMTAYRIDQSKSHVRFELDEDFFGDRVTVVGSTELVFGEIALDLNDLSTTQLSPIQINARGFLTDNGFRNRAIHKRILLTDLYEFITFTPTSVNNLPAAAPIGEAVEFTIDGDLTMLETTLPVTFSAKVTAVSAGSGQAVSETKLKGVATAVIQRNDFDLFIPNATNVANVEQEVELIIAFSAN